MEDRRHTAGFVAFLVAALMCLTLAGRCAWLLAPGMLRGLANRAGLAWGFRYAYVDRAACANLACAALLIAIGILLFDRGLRPVLGWMAVLLVATFLAGAHCYLLVARQRWNLPGKGWWLVVGPLVALLVMARSWKLLAPAGRGRWLFLLVIALCGVSAVLLMLSAPTAASPYARYPWLVHAGPSFQRSMAAASRYDSALVTGPEFAVGNEPCRCW